MYLEEMFIALEAGAAAVNACIHNLPVYNIAVKYSAVLQCIAVQCSEELQCSAVQCSEELQCSAVQCSEMLQCSAVQCSVP